MTRLCQTQGHELVVDPKTRLVLPWINTWPIPNEKVLSLFLSTWINIIIITQLSMSVFSMEKYRKWKYSRIISTKSPSFCMKPSASVAQNLRPSYLSYVIPPIRKQTVFCIVCTVFLPCFFYVYFFLFVTSVRTTDSEWKLNCRKKTIVMATLALWLQKYTDLHAHDFAPSPHLRHKSRLANFRSEAGDFVALILL